MSTLSALHEALRVFDLDLASPESNFLIGLSKIINANPAGAKMPRSTKSQ